MDGAGQVACQVFLVGEACIRVLVGEAGFFSLWSVMKCPVASFEMSMGLM